MSSVVSVMLAAGVCRVLRGDVVTRVQLNVRTYQ